MDAGVRRVMGLISEMNVRYVVPVYQRPYSWGEEQCLQLWDDILACGRSREQTHFTGSIVTMQDGTASSQGVAALAVIDGQQRITTIALLLVALARYADAHGKERLPFSRQEILMSGYLTNPFRSGDDHYKLTLSKGDRATFKAVIDHLEDPSRPAPEGPSRILDNLALFERRLDALANVALVWEGLRRLEVVSVTMAQGRDNAQLIFESMNSTGKDLSAADLIRNFVLMKYPLDRQAQAYQTYWKPLEDVLAPLAKEGAFDDFIRCFFQMAYAPERLGDADLYQVFKRYVSANAYDANDRMGFLCLRLKDFAGYYVDAVRGGLSAADDADPVARRTSFHLAGIARLGGSAARPLVLELFRSCRRRECTRVQLADMLGVLESYLLRRAVCDCEGSAQEHFLRHLVAKLAAVRSAGEKYFESYVALFLVEEGTPRRFPTDDEFRRALMTRDCFGFAQAPFMLARLNARLAAGAAAGAATADAASGSAADAAGEDATVACAAAGVPGSAADASALPEGWGVEHVMPVGALSDPAWTQVLGPDARLAFEHGVNALGNLAPSGYPYDLQDGTLAQKQGRLARDGEGRAVDVPLCRDVLAAQAWGPAQIEARGHALADVALGAWPLPHMDAAVLEAFRPSRRAAQVKTVTWQDLVDAGIVQMDDVLVSASPMYPGRATVTSTGRIMLATGETFDEPTAAYERFLGSVGAHETGLNGWTHWRLGEGGPLLDQLR